MTGKVAVLLAGVAALLAPTASAQGFVRDDHGLTLLVTEPKPLDLAAVVSAAERAFGVKRAPSAKAFEAARGTTFLAGRTQVGFEVGFKTRLFLIRGVAEPALNEVSASFQEDLVRGPIRSHKGFVEIRAFDFTVPEIPKAKTRREREEERRAIAERAAKRAQQVDDELCLLLAQFFDQKPSAVYLHRSNWLFLVDDMTRDWLTRPRAIDRLTSAKSVCIRERPHDERAMESAAIKARAGWSRFVGFFGRRAGEDFRVLVELKEGNRSELVWIALAKADSSRLSGTVAQEPLTLRLKKGDAIEAERGQVRDWTFRNGGKTEGGFMAALVR